MRKVYLFDIGLLVLAGTVAGVLADEPVHPAKLSKADIAGDVFNRPGMIEVGKKADLVVLDQNVFGLDAYDIHKTRVIMTMMDCNVSYEATAERGT